MAQIHFFYNAVQPNLPCRKQLKLFITKLFITEKKKLQSLNYVFCTDDFLLDVNKRYLNHNFFTDIITFELAGKGQPTVGEIYISTDRVKDNANKLGCSFKEEIHRVIFHGVLHLCGYKDKTVAEQKKMREMEDKYLGLYFNK
jgi:probable rRNA maturation factor